MSFASNKRQFKSNPSINPETGRSIIIGGEKYKELQKKYSSPKRATRSPKTKSPKTRSSPQRSRKSPNRSPRMLKDPFEVLSDESIVKVLHKLSDENRLAWANASPKVRAIYNRMM